MPGLYGVPAETQARRGLGSEDGIDRVVTDSSKSTGFGNRALWAGLWLSLVLGSSLDSHSLYPVFKRSRLQAKEFGRATLAPDAPVG